SSVRAKSPRVCWHWPKASRGSPMSAFELLQPSTLEEALEIIAAPGFAGRPVSGATAISLMRRAGVLNVDSLVSLERLRESMRGIHLASDGQAQVDGLVTLGEMENHAGL